MEKKDTHTDLENKLVAFARVAELMDSLGNILRFIAAAVCALFALIIAGAFWVHDTTKGLAETQARQTALIDDRKASQTEWFAWRRAKDEIDTRLTTITEGLQKIVDHQQKQIDDLPRK